MPISMGVKRNGAVTVEAWAAATRFAFVILPSGMTNSPFSVSIGLALGCFAQ